MQDNSEETNNNYGLMTTNHVSSRASRASLTRIQHCYPFEQTLNNEIHDSFLDTSVDGWGKAWEFTMDTLLFSTNTKSSLT